MRCQNKIKYAYLQRDSILESGVDDQPSINDITQCISDILLGTADTLKLINKRGYNKHKRACKFYHKPWYDSDSEKHTTHLTKNRRVFFNLKAHKDVFYFGIVRPGFKIVGKNGKFIELKV